MFGMDTRAMLPYSEVSSNEFFVTTQVGLDAMLELKESLLKSYPR